jgi:hypothetical protein
MAFHKRTTSLEEEEACNVVRHGQKGTKLSALADEGFCLAWRQMNFRGGAFLHVMVWEQTGQPDFYSFQHRYKLMQEIFPIT